jgi:hypothetical protein
MVIMASGLGRGATASWAKEIVTKKMKIVLRGYVSFCSIVVGG